MTAFLRQKRSAIAPQPACLLSNAFDRNPDLKYDKIGKSNLGFLPTESATFADSDDNYGEDHTPSLSKRQSFITKVCNLTQFLTGNSPWRFPMQTDMEDPLKSVGWVEERNPTAQQRMLAADVEADVADGWLVGCWASVS